MLYPSDALVEGSADNVCLLLRRKLDEVNCISGYTDSQLRIVLGMLLSIKKSISVENVDIQMMSALDCISVEKRNEIINLCCVSCCHNEYLL